MPHQITWSMYNRIATLSVAVLMVLGLGACDILEVENPNTLSESELDNPTAARPMLNGLQASVTNALGSMYSPYSTVTDEVTWVGSRDAWLNLSRGFVGDPLNEFSDNRFLDIAEAEWMSREFVSRLEGFQEEGTLPDEAILAEAYLHGATAKTTVADMFDDWAFSNKTEAGEPIGEQNMTQLYDQALDFVNKGLDLGAGLEAELSAVRARILFSRSVWSKVHPTGQVNTDDPLVSNQEAAQAAQAALDAMDQDDFLYDLPVSQDGDFSSDIAFQINQRDELLPDTTVYVEPLDPKNAAEVGEVVFQDPVDEVTHPFLERIILNRYQGNLNEFSDITVASAREMHLIIAEVALANGDTGPGSEFRAHMNELRSLDDLSSYDGPDEEGVSRLELLKNSRQANLFMQGRRLTDMYRFGEISPGGGEDRGWQPSSDAVQNPGTFFPLTNTEIRANPNL